MTFDEILQSFELVPATPSEWELEEQLVGLARQDPVGLFTSAAKHLDAENRSARYVAAVAVGRAAEVDSDRLAREAERLLVPALRSAPDREVAEGAANALLHVWCQFDDEWVQPLELAADPDPNCRFAAAQYFALAFDDPAPDEIEQALARLAKDDDEDVRWWATVGRRDDEDDD